MPIRDVEESNAINYLLRNAQQHHVQLSLMADQKANIMIAATSILLTFSFTNFKQQNLFWGFLALFVFSLAALIMSLLSVMPSVRSEPGARRNPLFFGDFSQLSLEEYEEEMSEIMSTPQSTYAAIVGDIYTIGTSIKHRKYRFLSMAYRTFLTGVCTAAALFAIQTIFFYAT